MKKWWWSGGRREVVVFLCPVQVGSCRRPPGPADKKEKNCSAGTLRHGRAEGPTSSPVPAVAPPWNPGFWLLQGCGVVGGTPVRIFFPVFLLLCSCGQFSVRETHFLHPTTLGLSRSPGSCLFGRHTYMSRLGPLSQSFALSRPDGMLNNAEFP